jgi:predicted nucleic acid-binding protein
MAGSTPAPQRLLLDTNVVVAGLLWSGPPRRLLSLAIDGAFELWSSQVLLDELHHTLGYPRLAPASRCTPPAPTH